MPHIKKQRELYADDYGDYHDDVVWFIELFGFKLPVWRQVRLTNRRTYHDREK
jgi:hypothetical protein